MTRFHAVKDRGKSVRAVLSEQREFVLLTLGLIACVVGGHQEPVVRVEKDGRLRTFCPRCGAEA